MITFKQGTYIWILHCFILFLTGDSYELKCSVPSQRQHRSNNFCNISGEEYMCLQDIINIQNIELCSKKKQFQRPGYKIVWSSNFDGQTCETERYQPIIHFNLDESDCIFQKSICNEEGQITVKDGSPRNDRRCRCDYRRGYAFVSEPLNECNCIPSNEDCSCYLKHCPYLHKLSPDYKCVWQDDLHRSFNCTTLLERGVDKDMNRIKEYKHHITDKRADREMLSYSYFHADPHCTLHIIYTSLFHIMLFGITFIAYYVGERRRPAKTRDREYSDKTVFSNGLAGKRTGEYANMVNICCNGEERVINPKQSQKTISVKEEKMNHVSLNADTNEPELFFRKEEVQNLRQLFISVIELPRNIGNTAPEHEIDKQFYDFLRKLHNCLVSKMKLPDC